MTVNRTNVNVVGGYRSNYLLRPPYLYPVWGMGLGFGIVGTQRFPRPWYLQELGKKAEGLGGAPNKLLEEWPMIIFDVAKSGVCAHLDQRIHGKKDHFSHDVPLDALVIRFQVWEAPVDEAKRPEVWVNSKPASLESVAVVLATYDIKDRGSYEQAMQLARNAEQVLSAPEAEGYALVHVVIVGVTDVAGSEDKLVEVSPTDGMADMHKGQSEQVYMAPCGTAAAVHDVLVSTAREVLASAVQRRQLEEVRDEKLKDIGAIMEGGEKGLFRTKVDAHKLEVAIKAAEEAGCHQLHLQIPRKKLSSVLVVPRAAGETGIMQRVVNTLSYINPIQTSCTSR